MEIRSLGEATGHLDKWWEEDVLGNEVRYPPGNIELHLVDSGQEMSVKVSDARYSLQTRLSVRKKIISVPGKLRIENMDLHNERPMKRARTV